MSRTLVDSGIEWIGKIPSDWDIQKIKYICDYYNGVGHEGEQDFDGKYILINSKFISTEGIVKKYTENQLFPLYSDDVCIVLSDLPNGKALARTFLVDCNNTYTLNQRIAVLRNSKIIPKFLSYYLNRNQFFLNFDDGSNQTNLKKESVVNCPVLVPPEEVQKRIADYLDSKCSKIDQVIEDNNKAIELLEEYRKSRINDVVALGLKKETKLKETGIKFFKKIPSHWQVKKLKYIVDSFSKGNGITKDEVFADGDIQCVRYGEIYSKYNNSFIKSVSRTFVDRINSPKYIDKGDILCAATGELVEEIGKNIVYLGNESCIVGGDIIIIKHSQNPRYLNYLLNSSLSQEQKSEGKAKLKVVHIYASEMSNIILPLPPIDEQNEIADYLDKMCSNVNKVIEYRKKIIEKLEEYKKSLIYEVVTGKKEV